VRRFGYGSNRVDGLKLVRLAQGLAMAQSALLAVFTLTGHMTVPLLLGLCLWQGFINALDWPARQALTYRLAGDRALLDNVIALNSITFNPRTLVGPGGGGISDRGVGTGSVFALDARRATWRLWRRWQRCGWRPQVKKLREAHPFAALRDAARYAWAHPTIRRGSLAAAPVTAARGDSRISVLAPGLPRINSGGYACTLGFSWLAAIACEVRWRRGVMAQSEASADRLRGLVTTLGAR